MESDADQMANIWDGLRERYPLLDRVVVHSLGEEYAENFPLFFGLFLAALDDTGGSPCCFVLPRCGQMARLAATVFGLSVFRREFAGLARAYAERKFNLGERVRVHPSNHVFEFGGFWANEPERFCLCTLDGSGRRTFPASDALRLEPTRLVTPRGRLGTAILSPEPTPLDEVLGIPLFGNLSLFKNRVLCLDDQSRFGAFAAEHGLYKEDIDAVSNLADLLPFGKLREGAAGNPPTFENWSTRYPNAEPLVAVTSSCERLAAFCSAAPARTKVVAVNGLKGFSNLQAFDEISACQRLVLFADHDDEERMKTLEARGCRFWVFGEREFFSTGVLNQEADSRTGAFGSVIHRARNLARLRVHSEPCESGSLNAIALHLEKLRPELDSEAANNPSGPLGRLAQRLWRMLNEAAGWCRELPEVERNRFTRDLTALRDELEKGALWINSATVTDLRSLLESFQALFEPGSQLGVSKGIALRSAVGAARLANVADLAVLARTENLARSTEEWLRSSGLKLPVFTLAAIPEEASFDRLIVTSWPGSDGFRRLAGKLVSADIVTITYDFEARWLGQCQRRLSQRMMLTPVSPTEKTALVSGGNPRIVWPEDGKPEVTSQVPGGGHQAFDVWTYEQRLKSIRKGARDETVTGLTVMAKYVSYVGDSYALLTRWHKLPVATRLFGASNTGQKALPERAVDDLKPADIVVFPEGGQKAVLAQMADRLIGPDAQTIRMRSRLWRQALQSSGMSPEEFLRNAQTRHGQVRHILTIRNWYHDEAQIGPAEREDLDLIAVITESDALQKAADDVWEAITFLRSNHLGAGSVLRDAVLEQLREALPSIEENGSRIEVPNLGAAWVVQVEAIAPEFVEEPKNKVDRLLWDNR